MTAKNAGRWQPGQTGNPKGRPAGQAEITKLRAALAAHIPSIIDQLVVGARAGDVQAARLLLERILPPVRALEPTVQLDLPANGTLTEQGRAVLSAVADGALAPSQGSALLSAIATLGRVVELDEMEARISALEKAHERS